VTASVKDQEDVDVISFDTHPPKPAMSLTLPRVAVVGCGAAAREFCLPRLTRHNGYRFSVVVVDRHLPQAEAVAEEFGIEHYCADYQNLPLDVEAAIITTPHHLHAEQSIFFLQPGKSVFVEKPLGMSALEVTRMLDAARANRATLMVNNCRRLFPAYRSVRDLLHSGEYGKVLQIAMNDGSEFAWNSVSAFYIKDAAAARGVFLDRGAHTVDILCWWLADRPRVVQAWSDAIGGAETVMDVDLASGDTSIQLKFSRLYKLDNCFHIECEDARIDGRLFNASDYQVTRNGQTTSIPVEPPVLYHEYAWKLVDNFIGVIQGRENPLFVAEDVAPSISVLEEAYQRAVPYELPWYDSDPNISFLRENQTKSANH
jgi:predicted dehydrogenase